MTLTSKDRSTPTEISRCRQRIRIRTGFSYNTWCVQVLRSPKEVFAAAKQSWRERCEKCVCLQGDYVEK